MNASASDFNIVKLTDNDVNDKFPDIYEDNVVWQHWDKVRSNYEIYLNSIEVTNNKKDDTMPVIFGSNIAWTGMDQQYPYYRRIYKNGVPITNPGDIIGNPVMNSGNVVWSSTYDIFLNGTKITNSNNEYNLNPSIYGNNIVWTNRSLAKPESGAEIYFNGANISNNDTADDHPDIFESNIVWQSWDNANNCWQIYKNGNLVTSGNNNKVAPKIYGEDIVWMENDGNHWQIVYNGKYLTAGDYDNYSPEIYGDKIVWMQFDGNDYEIYKATVTPEPASFLLFGMGGLIIRILKRRKKV
ncbi:MAG: PEP-CTERM sorting domain-containing protein [Candidatus Omnitrophica bacterium]|nr:PEP-CTERM sorting domain-containing protein [Candidatus Omnitrophota bacterium]